MEYQWRKSYRSQEEKEMFDRFNRHAEFTDPLRAANELILDLAKRNLRELNPTSRSPVSVRPSKKPTTPGPGHYQPVTPDHKPNFEFKKQTFRKFKPKETYGPVQTDLAVRKCQSASLSKSQRPFYLDQIIRTSVKDQAIDYGKSLKVKQAKLVKRPESSRPGSKLYTSERFKTPFTITDIKPQKFDSSFFL